LDWTVHVVAPSAIGIAFLGWVSWEVDQGFTKQM
jgi:hypothetical protein